MWPDLLRGRMPLAPVRVGVDRVTGRVLIGWPHVEQSMATIFATRFHDRVLRRWVGSFVPHMLGEPIIARIITRFFWAIAEALELWEPDFRIKRVFLLAQEGTTASLLPDLPATAEQIRSGHASFRTDGIYRPRAHLGDTTPEGQRSIGFVGRGGNVWDALQ